MRITAADSSKALTSTPLLAVLAAEGEAPSLPRGVKLPAAAERDFSGKARSDRMADATAGPAERVLLLGLGKEPSAEELRRAAGVWEDPVDEA